MHEPLLCYLNLPSRQNYYSQYVFLYQSLLTTVLIAIKKSGIARTRMTLLHKYEFSSKIHSSFDLCNKAYLVRLITPNNIGLNLLSAGELFI